MSWQREIGTERGVLARGIAGDEPAILHILLVGAAVLLRLSSRLRSAILFHTARDPAHTTLDE